MMHGSYLVAVLPNLKGKRLYLSHNRKIYMSGKLIKDATECIHCILLEIYSKMVVQWSLSYKTSCCETDLLYVTALLLHQVVFLVENAPLYATASPREKTQLQQEGRSSIAVTTVTENIKKKEGPACR